MGASDQTQTNGEYATKMVFTTGEAAEICNVSQQTIIRCFDAGRLLGFRVPGSKFRRIPRDELLRFMRSNNIPVDVLESRQRRVLIVDDDHAVLDVYRQAFARDNRFEVRTADNGYDAGVLTETFRPHLVVLDYRLPDIAGDTVCKRIKANPRLSDVRVLCASGAASPEEQQAILEAGADAFVQKPFDIEALMTNVYTLLSMPAGTSEQSA
ncbi:MAG: response regulator [Phycisphaeraceae bacterium]|nr:response regulator [Phycisphaeraceae bacterium]